MTRASSVCSQHGCYHLAIILGRCVQHQQPRRHYDHPSAPSSAAQIARAKQVLVPAGKDITEYHQAGGNIRQWVISLLPDEERPPKAGCRICYGTEWQRRDSKWVLLDMRLADSMTPDLGYSSY